MQERRKREEVSLRGRHGQITEGLRNPWRRGGCQPGAGKGAEGSQAERVSTGVRESPLAAIRRANWGAQLFSLRPAAPGVPLGFPQQTPIQVGSGHVVGGSGERCLLGRGMHSSSASSQHQCLSWPPARFTSSCNNQSHGCGCEQWEAREGLRQNSEQHQIVRAGR